MFHYQTINLYLHGSVRPKIVQFIISFFRGEGEGGTGEGAWSRQMKKNMIKSIKLNFLTKLKI